LNEIACSSSLSEFLSLLGASLITPDNRRAQYLIGLIEQHRTVHLPGEADTGNR
jgi:hypothetical protein